MLKVNPQPLTFIVALKLMLKFKLTNSKLKQTAFKRNNTNDLMNQTEKTGKKVVDIHVLKDEKCLLFSISAHLQFHWLNCDACAPHWIILWAILPENLFSLKSFVAAPFISLAAVLLLLDRCIEKVKLLSQHRLYVSATTFQKCTTTIDSLNRFIKYLIH